MSEEEWVRFYNKDGQDVDACIPIGSMIMEESYIKDGKKDKIHEFYYAAVCKKPTQKQYDLVGSPTFKKEMERIFKTHKFEEDN